MVRVLSKGAPDMVLEKVTHCLSGDGQKVSINDDGDCPTEYLSKDFSDPSMPYLEIFNRVLKNFAENSWRTILVTYKDMSMEEFEELKSNNNDFEYSKDRECLEEGLTALGIYGIMDPIREGVRASIKQC